MPLVKKKILLTGSSGYIGNCLKKFLNKKYNVYFIDKKKLSKNEKNFFLCNILNKKKVENIIKKINPDIIIHLAGQSTIDAIKNKKSYIYNNVLATNILLKLIKKNNIKYFIFSSTAAVYKSSNYKLLENSKKNPKNIYGQTKSVCEKNIIKNLKNSSQKFIIFRFFNACSALNNFKVGERHNPETHLIPIIVNKFLKKKYVKIYSKNITKTCIRDYVHIYDLCNAIHKGVDHLIKRNKSNIFNIGSDKSYSVWSVVNYFNNHFAGKKLKFIFTKKRLGDLYKLVCSNSKIKRILKWKPRKSKLNIIFRDELIWQKYLMKKSIKRTLIY